LGEAGFMSSSYTEWDEVYRNYPLEELGWELGKPRPILVEFVEKDWIPKGKALDLCCGAGTNTVYLAQNGFNVAGMDISHTALKYAKKKALQAGVQIDFGVHSFVELPFADTIFAFVFDMGCFHHVQPEDRQQFIHGVHRVLKASSVYMLTCFSYRNGSGWNHFTRQQLKTLFSELFTFKLVRHFSSVEGDGVTRFFYTVLMEKKK